MTDPRPELVEATRLLVQWGRARQTAWHDPSRDLLAALGTRHASFSDFSDQRSDHPPVPDRCAEPQRPHAGETRTPPTVVIGPPAGSPAVTATPQVASPAAVSLPPVSAEPRTHATAMAPVASSPVASGSVRRRWLRLTSLAVAAVAVLAVVAVPVVRRSYRSSGALVAPQLSRVVIDSKPPGSIVLVDDVERGKTPLMTELPAGIHRVELRYRKNVRAFDLEVVAGMPAEATVDWTKKPAVKRKAAPQKSADTKTAVVTPAPTATAKTEPEAQAPLDMASQPAVSSDAPETPKADPPTETTPDKP